jgi:predicted phosphodiesterase
MKIAVLADVHGNLGALDAVLADVTEQRVDLTVNLGDLLSGALHPRETADRLLALGLPTVRGNHERQVLTLPREQMTASDRLAHDTSPTSTGPGSRRCRSPWRSPTASSPSTAHRQTT